MPTQDRNNFYSLVRIRNYDRHRGEGFDSQEVQLE